MTSSAASGGGTPRSKPLEGRVALVTGAGRGIGRAIASALALDGASVALCARTRGQLEETREEIWIDGGTAIAVPMDVTRVESVERGVAAAEQELGPVDILVNNAGVATGVAPTWQSEPEEWWRVQEVNVLGPLLCIRSIVPGMLERRRGHVVNIVSYKGARPSPWESAYGCSKAALIRMTDTLAMETSGSGVATFAVSPGWVRTEMTKNARSANEGAVRSADLGAALVARLVRGDADALSGLLIHVDDDLEALLRDAMRLKFAGRYQLRLFRGFDEEEPV